MKKYLFILLTIFQFSNTINAQSLKLTFNNQFNGKPLEFGKAYITPLGDSLTFSTLNYFISNIQMVQESGQVYIVPQDSAYFLLKQKGEAFNTIELNNIPEGNYKELVFTIGVDSLRNTMDITKRTGTLDVGAAARGMYWVWNSGYIFFKLEGKTINQVDSLRKNFRYHIGGYGGYETKTINNIKIKNLALDHLIVDTKKHPVIHVEVNIDKFFDNSTPVKISEHPSVMWGDFSVKIANNYVNIFKLSEVVYE